MYTNKLRTLRNILGICLVILTIFSIINFLFEISGESLIPIQSAQVLPFLSALLIIFILINKYVEDEY